MRTKFLCHFVHFCCQSHKDNYHLYFYTEDFMILYMYISLRASTVKPLGQTFSHLYMYVARYRGSQAKWQMIFMSTVIFYHFCFVLQVSNRPRGYNDYMVTYNLIWSRARSSDMFGQICLVFEHLGFWSIWMSADIMKSWQKWMSYVGHKHFSLLSIWELICYNTERVITGKNNWT